MMNPRYLQRFGEPPPFGDPIARAALRYDPEAPYGEPELEGTEGQRQFEPPDVQPSRNKDSMVASSAPMSQSPVTAPPPAAMENPIVRAGRERAESVNDPYLDYDSEVPIRATRQAFQPPPTIESNALKSRVSIDDAPEIGSGPLPPPPVIDTRELPTEAPPENPIRRYQRELDALQAPERGPVSKWAKLAALALGAGQGYYNAANPNARPIDASEAVQNLTLGRKYIDAMGEYQRKRKDIGERIKLAGDAEDIESRIADRTETQASRKAANDERAKNNQRTDADRNFAFSLGLARDGGTVVQSDDPPTPGARRITNPMDPTGRTSVDIVPKKENRRIGNQEIANLLRMNVDDLISDTMYQDAVGKLVDLQKARIAAEAKPDSTLTPDYKNYLLSQKDGFKGTFEQWQDKDANRKRPVNNITTSYAPSPDGTADPTIEAMAKYEIDVPRPRSSSPAAMAQYDQIIKAVKKLNPQYDATVFQTAQRTIDAFNSGNESRSVNAINTAAGHVGVLAQAARALDSGDITLLNKIANAYGTQTGNDKLSVYKTIVHRLAPEITRSYVGAGGGEGDRIANESDFDPSLGTKRILANLGTTANLYQSKINALGHQFEKGARGRKFEGYITPEAQGVFDSFAPKAGPGRGGGIPTANTPGQYAALPSGSEYIGPDGKKARKP